MYPAFKSKCPFHGFIVFPNIFLNYVCWTMEWIDGGSLEHKIQLPIASR